MTDLDLRGEMIEEAWARVFVAYCIGAIDISTCKTIERALFPVAACNQPPMPNLALFVSETRH
jgi:hypothetical protein